MKLSIWRAVRGCVEIRASHYKIPGFSLAFAGLFYICSKRASHARLLNTEPFRMTLEDAGLVIGAFLWAGILCDKVHH
ncbi:hypothetical protein FJQ53_10420 [Escherichia coli]|nr:hypothetical protein [Escherichia coli]EEX1771956.1 hypothetical protein [Escherichia coli]EEY4001546.1 hypothetical protein [Escherichia coli]EFA4466145.1 hypothetical protein [Escherichia coli]EFA4992904.1 hypothetical protein [Escherichia coli]